MEGFSFDGKTLKYPVFEPVFPISFIERINKGAELIASGNAKAANAYLDQLSPFRKRIGKCPLFSRRLFRFAAYPARWLVRFLHGGMSEKLESVVARSAWERCTHPNRYCYRMEQTLIDGVWSVVRDYRCPDCPAGLESENFTEYR